MKKIMFQGLILLGTVNSLFSMEQEDLEEKTYPIEYAQELALEYAYIQEKIKELEKENKPENFAATHHFYMSVTNPSFQIPEASAKLLQDESILQPGENKVSEEIRYLINALKPAAPQNNN